MTVLQHSSAPPMARNTVQTITGKAHSWLYRLAAQAKERTEQLRQQPPQAQAQAADLDQRVRQLGEW